MLGSSACYVIVFLQLALEFLEIGILGDFFRQVGCQLALDVFPDLLLIVSLRDQGVAGVGCVEVFFFHQGKGQSDELVCGGGSGLSWGVLVVAVFSLVVSGILRAMGIEGERDLVEGGSQELFPLMRGGEMVCVHLSGLGFLGSCSSQGADLLGVCEAVDVAHFRGKVGRLD